MKFNQEFDVIVIGAGHAGCEAAHAAAQLQAKTLLLTLNLDHIGQMSCNPAIGGLGKGHLVREIDALGGIMGQVADRTAIQYRLLNRRKGPAVRGPRAQIDKSLYRREMRCVLDHTPNLQIRQAEAVDLLVSDHTIQGVSTDWQEHYGAKAVIMTTGTFLTGLVHIGTTMFPAGRLGDQASLPISAVLRRLGVTLMRMKTGTPPRLDGRTIHWDKLEIQHGDDRPAFFSFLTQACHLPQTCCHIVWTTPETKRLIQDNLHLAPLYSGQIKGIGPRYCPSIEDKVVRFADKDHHQIFLEPEGLATHEIYPNGISTSLPIEVQWAVVRSIPGLEAVQILRPGYAIEYDMADPRQLEASLQVKGIQGLYFAGQINGTTGYEEAAAQGLVAGINAAQAALGKAPVVFNRGQSYIGVMVDDLITKGVDEPYRMFTSRAEFRLLLRSDNADLRLTALGRQLGLVNDSRWEAFSQRQQAIAQAQERLGQVKMRLESVLVDRSESQSPGISRTGLELLARQDVDPDRVFAEAGLADLALDVRGVLEADIHYQGYLDKQQEEVMRLQRTEDIVLPQSIEWAKVPGLSIEIQQKLQKVGPGTLGQANRIPGMTPAAITAILLYLRKS